MDATTVDERTHAQDLSDIFSTAIMTLAVCKGPWKPSMRRELLPAFAPAMVAVCQLFHLTDDELLFTRDFTCLATRRAVWYLSLVEDYPAGQAGLSQMAARMAEYHTRLTHAGGLGRDEIKDIIVDLSHLVSVLEGYLSMPNNLDFEWERNDPRIWEVKDGQLVDKDAETEAESEEPDWQGAIRVAGAHQAIIVWRQSLSSHVRHYYIMDPVLPHPNLLEDVEDCSGSENKISLMEMLDSMKPPVTMTAMSHFLAIRLDLGGSWEEFEDKLEVVLSSWFSTDFVACFSIGLFTGDDED